MLETYFSASKMRAHLRSGPSGPYLDGFAAALERQGYSADTAVRYLRAAAHLGHVVARQGAMPNEIDLAAFSEHLRSCRCPRAMGGRRNHHTIFGARLFRRHLVEIGVCQPVAAPLQRAEPCLVAHFKEWLRKHRGASDATIELYARDAARLVAALGDDPERWEPAAVRSFFLDRASHCGKGTVEKLTTSLRAFLRYLAVKGRCRAGLADVVPGYAHWRLADLPRYLAAEQVNRLIAASGGEVVERRRDRAILLLLARLGLRAGDVAQLRLDDIEWETGSLRVSGKSRYEVRLTAATKKLAKLQISDNHNSATGRRFKIQIAAAVLIQIVAQQSADNPGSMPGSHRKLGMPARHPNAPCHERTRTIWTNTLPENRCCCSGCSGCSCCGWLSAHCPDCCSRTRRAAH